MSRHGCTNCGRERALDCRSARCQTCQRYWRQHGTEHPLPIRLGHAPAAGNPSHGGAPRACARCTRVRPTHAHGYCAPCYVTLWRRDELPVRPVRGSVPCQDCGLRPMDLHYAHRGHRGLTLGRCYRCYHRYYCRRRAQEQAA